MPVYFVLDRQSKAVKVGYVEDPEDIWKRVGELQCGNPNLLRCLALYEGTRITEAAVHKYLETERISGEWFKVYAFRTHNGKRACWRSFRRLINVAAEEYTEIPFRTHAYFDSTK